MKEYLDLVKTILSEGKYKENRTGVDTISYFSGFHKVNLSNGFPLLTTKKMTGKRWNSLIHELLWFISGEDHIRNLSKHTKIWNAWADKNYDVGPAYGRQWRKYKGVTYKTNEIVEIDQLQNAIDKIKHKPNDRRIIVTAWNPAQIEEMALPPCHHTYTFNVLDDKLNCHLDQRSCDVALGVPFNIASYALLTHIIAQETGYKPGEFAHTLVDLHAYCGDGKDYGLKQRGQWYKENLSDLQNEIKLIKEPADYLGIKEWIESIAPEESKKGIDHIPGLLEQLSRDTKSLPNIKINNKQLEELVFEDFSLENYESHPGIKFEVAV